MGPKKGQLYNSAAVEAEKAKGANCSRELLQRKRCEPVGNC